ncbi:hypothetical protein [Brachybacterium sp. GPGPB12]|uniref:hypothetical protein n=1 Tax=Brachybacterium sp. GPGPB12 TaxID=3023517 RepID=UPI0031344595
MTMVLEAELMRGAVIGKRGDWLTLSDNAQELGLDEDRFRELAEQARAPVRATRSGPRLRPPARVPHRPRDLRPAGMRGTRRRAVRSVRDERTDLPVPVPRPSHRSAVHGDGLRRAA